MAASLFTSLYPSIASWFTPTYLFCFLNLMIGTIFIVSNFKSHKHHHDEQHQQQQHTQLGEFNSPQLGRVPSLLERVKSIDFSLYKYEKPDPVYTQNAGPSQLERTPSLLERVKSLSLHKQEQPFPDSEQTQFPDPPQLVRYPSFLQRVKSFTLSKEEQPDPDSEVTQYPDPTKLVRYPTLLQRVESIKASLYKSEQPDPFSAYADPDPNELDHHVVRSKSEKAPARVTAKMKKSASTKNVGPSTTEGVDDVDIRRPETTRERKRSVAASFGEDEEVDAKADDFINRFKQQLKLQRLDSLIRYNEMLNRGASK